MTVARRALGPLVGPARRGARAFAELFALCGFALAMPLYDVFGRAPDQFIFRGARSDDIVWFAVVVLLGPALVLSLLEAAVAVVSRPARRGLHVAFIAVLVAAFAVQALRSPLGDGWPLMAAAAAVGAFAGWLYVRTTGMRIWLAFASVAPPIFCALFLFGSQTAQLLSDPNAAGDIQVGEPAPVVVIVFDELPLNSLMASDGRVDADLFPNFAALAGGSHWFRNTTAVSNFTWNAVPSIITGSRTGDHTTPTAQSHPRSLFTLLGGSMELKVSESVTRLCPTDLCKPRVPHDGGLGALLEDARDVLGQRLAPDPSERDPVAGLVDDAAADTAADSAGQVAADDRTQEFIDGLDGSSETLHYLHVLLPHVPYRFLPDGTRYRGPDPDLGRDGDTWQDQPALVQLGRQRHLLQLAYADALLGRIVETMEDSGLYDDALLTVVADHGISFEAGQAIRGLDVDRPLTDAVAADIMWVPFFVKEPGQTKGTVDDDNVETIDVLPTIADALGIDIPWEIDGRSALGGPPRTGPRKSMNRADTDDGGVVAGEAKVIDEALGWRLLLQRAVDRFVPADGPDRLFRIGEHPDLYGTAVADARPGRLRPVPGRLDPQSAAGNVDPGSGEVPALVRAALDGPVAAGTPVAVAVNGTVWAVVDAHQAGGETRVAAMVPRRAFTKGANTITFATVAG